MIMSDILTRVYEGGGAFPYWSEAGSLPGGAAGTGKDGTWCVPPRDEGLLADDVVDRSIEGPLPVEPDFPFASDIAIKRPCTSDTNMPELGCMHRALLLNPR
jgi:hypothetical protein